MADLFKLGGAFKPRNVAGVKNSRFIEPHDCEEIAEHRVKYANADKLVRRTALWSAVLGDGQWQQDQAEQARNQGSGATTQTEPQPKGAVRSAAHKAGI